MLLLGLVAGAAALRYRAVVTNEFRKRDLAAPGQPISGFKEQKLRAPRRVQAGQPYTIGTRITSDKDARGSRRWVCPKKKSGSTQYCRGLIKK